MRGSLKLNKQQKKKGQNRKTRFKSSLEKLFAAKLLALGLGAAYEPDRFEFVKRSHYVPDFKIANKKYVETKGFFASSDRSKLVTFKEQYPEIEILLVFGNASNRLNRNSKTTYGEWATKHGFRWIDITQPIPQEWWT